MVDKINIKSYFLVPVDACSITKVFLKQHFHIIFGAIKFNEIGNFGSTSFVCWMHTKTIKRVNTIKNTIKKKPLKRKHCRGQSQYSICAWCEHILDPEVALVYTLEQAVLWHEHYWKIWAEEANNKLLAALITVVKVPLCKALNPQISLVSCSLAKQEKTGQVPGVNGCKCEYKAGCCRESSMCSRSMFTE